MNRAERFRQLTCRKAVRADLRGRSVRAALYTGAASLTDFVVRIGSTAVLARILLPEHFGLVMMATAVTAIADQLRDLGLSSATVQKPEITHEEVTNLFWINVVVGAFLALAMCITAPLVAGYFREPRMVPITCVLAATFVAGGLSVQHQALLTRQLRLGQTSTIRLLSNVVSTLLAIGLAMVGYGPWALVWREIVRSALIAAGMWFCFPWIPGLPYWNTNVRGMVRFGTNLTIANVIATAAAGADRFLLGRFWGAAPVAMYRQAYQLITAPTDQLLGPIYQVTQPCLSMLQHEAEHYRRFYAKVVTSVAIITMPASLFVAVYASEITALLLGPRWSDAAPVLSILSLATFVKQTVSSTSLIPITRGKGGIYLQLSVWHNITMVVLMAIGVHWGVKGVAIAETATIYLLVWPRLHYNLKGSSLSVGQFLSSVARPAMASVAMATSVWVLHSHPPVHSPIAGATVGAIVGALVFTAVLLLLPGGAAEVRTLGTDIISALKRPSAARGRAEELLVT